MMEQFFTINRENSDNESQYGLERMETEITMKNQKDDFKTAGNKDMH